MVRSTFAGIFMALSWVAGETARPANQVEPRSGADDETVSEHRIDKRYLVWPVKRQLKGGKPDCRFFLEIDGELFTFADIQLATGEPDFWVFTDLLEHQGKCLKIRCDLDDKYKPAFEKVVLADEMPGMENVYKEKLRPRFHFSSKRGWLNDSNGMIYHDGEWHLFYQHNPYNWHWCNISWGHAVSRDMLHWEELPAAIVPGAEGVIYSGSGAVDFDNDSGLRSGRENVMIAAYTGNGLLSYIPGLDRVQCLSYSNDRGRTWTKYPGNPVIPNKYNSKDRDPKIFKHVPTGKWVMIYYENHGVYHVNTSSDLVNWTETGSYKTGGHECPDMFELMVDGDPKKKKWVVWSGNGKYQYGEFDGERFIPESGTLQSYFGQAYAGQTFSHSPGGRQVHIGWFREDKSGMGAGHVGMPFNQQMTLPMEFSLKTCASGIRMFIEPVKELETLRETLGQWDDLNVDAGEDPLAGVTGDCLEIEAEIELGTATGFGFVLRGEPVAYNVASQELNCAGVKTKVPPVNGKLRLQIYLDITSIEAFANGGYAYLSKFKVFDDDEHAIKMFVNGGNIALTSLRIHQIQSIWK